MDIYIALAVLTFLAGGVEEDVRRAEEEFKLYSTGSRDFQKDADATGKLHKRFAKVRAWLAEAQKTYEQKIKMGTPDGRAIQAKLKNLDTGLQQFQKKRDSFLESFPGELERALKKQNKDGIRTAASLVDLKEALDGADSEDVKEARGKIRVLNKLLSADSPPKPTKTAPPRRPEPPHRPPSSKSDRAVSEAPRDEYVGKDIEDLRKTVREAWAKKYPQDEIVSVLMAMKDWKRSVKKTLNSDGKSAELSDTSVLAARVLVKKDAENASIYMAFLNRDNLSESIRNVGVDTKGSQYVVETILLSQLDPATANASPKMKKPDLPKPANPKADRVLTEPQHDEYAGKDKDNLRQQIEAAWAKKYPQDKLLLVVFSAKEWKRTVKKAVGTDRKSLDLSDTSVLPVRVVVEKDTESALIFMAFVNRDNLSNSIRNIGCDTKNSTYVIEEIPLKLLNLE